MTVKDLQQFFKHHLVPSRLYSLKGGNHNNRICMSRERDGSYNVYFSDHREKVGLMHFATESEACRAMKEQVGKLMELIYGLQWAQRV